MTGVKQEYILSPLMFNVLLDEVMRKAASTPKGVQWLLINHVEILEYGDEISLLAHTHSEMQAKINNLQCKAAEVGFKINIIKTKTLRTNTTNQVLFIVHSRPIEDVANFNCFGSIITRLGGAKKDIENRLKLARMAFGVNTESEQRRLEGQVFVRND
ncbi:uncharacterized protein LOC129614669 [Condylostylus longicornis]|uniref:uncharacterized protein LOC129614669 n=1 Tax=Condylostylus longicornis TaxID=2530218 RepID=UPI00244E1C3E|nr:uncharacterized protein LOC129614669 [Condylostylus longicornis]